MRTKLLIAVVICAGIAGCGPTIVPVKVVEAPRKKATPPAISAEEKAGEVPTLKPLVEPKLVPEGFRPPPAPADPVPLEPG